MLVSVKMPALKHWEVDGVQITNFWFLPDISEFELIFENFKFDFDASFKLDEHGYLDPVVQSCDINFGKSYFYHNNGLVAIFMHQIIYFAIITIQNSVYFAG